MPYTPELPPEIRRRWVTRFVGLSKLRDLAEGDDFGTFFGVMADELSSHQQLLKEFIDGHFLDAKGEVLDERIAQLPGGFRPRQGAKAARGGGITLYREDASQSEVYDPGSITLGRSSAPSLSYLNFGTVTFAPGVYSVSGITVICTSTGVTGNAPANGVDTLLGATGTIYRVVSDLPVTGGFDREEDNELQARAKLWVRSLTRTTPDAIVAIAMNFESSDGETLRNSPPTLWEDPDNRGYCELIIDNGFGFVGYTRDAATTTGVFPSVDGTPRFQLPFEYPAVSPPVLSIEGVEATPPHPDYVTLEERGLIITRESPMYLDVTAGNTWEIGGHKVLFGFPAELQAYVEQNCRAAGNRVRVVLPDPQPIQISANVTVEDGYTFEDVFDRIKRGITIYMARLPPGQPLLFFRLGGDLITIPGVRNILFDQTDRYPASPRTKLICYYSDITLR